MTKVKADWLSYLKVRDEYKNKKAKIRAAVFASQINICARCGSTNNLTIDHVEPMRMGGTNSVDNFQILCMDCNRQKGAR